MAANRFYGVKNHPEEGKNGIYDSWDTCSAAVKGVKGVLYKGFKTQEEAQSFCNEGVEQTAPKAANRRPSVRQEPVASGPVVFDARRAMDSLDYLKDCDVMDGDMYAKVKQNIGEKSMQYVDEKPIGIDPSRKKIDGLSVYVDGSYNERSGRAGFGVHIQGYGLDTRGRGPETVLFGSVPTVDGGRNAEGEVTAAWVALQHIQMLGTNKPITVYHDHNGVGKWADGEWRTNKSYTEAYANFVDSLRDSGMDVRFVHVFGHTGVEPNEVVDRLAKMGCGVHFPREAEFKEEFSHVPGGNKPIIMDMPPYQQDIEAVQAKEKDTGMEF